MEAIFQIGPLSMTMINMISTAISVTRYWNKKLPNTPKSWQKVAN